jgi:hypothetical protein
MQQEARESDAIKGAVSGVSYFLKIPLTACVDSRTARKDAPIMARPVTLPPSKLLFSDLFDENTGECKSPKQLVQRREEFIEAVSKSTYDGLTGRTFIDGESADGVPLAKNRATVAAELRESARRGGFSKSANVFNYSEPQTGYGELLKEWTVGDALTTGNPIGTGLVPFDLPLGIAAW